MAKIKLSQATYKMPPEGLNVFKITAVDYNETFGKITVTMKTPHGETHTERFMLIKTNGQPNDTALNIFSSFARTALGDNSVEEIDEQQLVGKYIKAEISYDHVASQDNPEDIRTYSRIVKRYPATEADWMGTASPADVIPEWNLPKASIETTDEPLPFDKKHINLDDIFGGGR